VILGLVTSASAGTEGLIKASRLALADHINAKDTERQASLKVLLFEELLVALENNMEDDRYCIPTMEVIGFLLDSGLTATSADSPKRYGNHHLRLQMPHFNPFYLVTESSLC
jgi:hypothetical protein